MLPHQAPTGLDHVSLLARRVERTVQFYRDILGLQPIDQPQGQGRSASEEIRLGDGLKTFLVIGPSGESPAGELGIGTIHHFALAVASDAALLKWKRWLRDNEVLVYGPYNQQAYRDLVFADPDGVMVEIATPGPGFGATQDGTEVYEPPKETMAPYRDEQAIEMETWPEPVGKIEPDMVLYGLHHVATITSSLPRTDAFYREKLRLPLVRKVIDSDDPEVQRWYWGLEGGQPGTLVAGFPITHPHEGGESARGRVGPGVTQHYALTLGGSGAGTEASSAPAEAGGNAISLQDPDGLDIELVIDR